MMKRTLVCLATCALLAACSGNNTTGNNTNADTGSSNNSLVFNNSDECCPTTSVPSGANCRLECGPCEFEEVRGQPACGTYTVSCDGSTWVELNRSAPTDACVLPADMGNDMQASDMGMAGDAGSDMSEPPDMFMFPDVAAQECFHPSTDANCPMGEFGAGTFLDYLEVDESEQCCRDFTGDGVNDNKIGKYIRILRGTGEDMNGNIDAAIQAGLLVYLFDYSNWSNDTYDSDLDLRVFLGADEDFDFSDNLAGTGNFVVTNDSFDDNGDPRWLFEDVQVINGRLIARNGELELFFPGLLDDVELLMTDVRIEADVVTPADLQSGGRVSLENGELSGALHRNLFYDSMNQAAESCACIGQAVYEYDADDDFYNCVVTTAIETACEFDPSTGCRFLSNRTGCQFFELASSDIDVDTDGDGTVDAFSVGVKFTGVGASITGREN